MEQDTINKINVLYNERKFKEIIQYISTIDENEKSNEIISLLGKTLVRIGDYEDAKYQFESIMYEYSEDKIFCFRYALALYLNNQYDEAMKWFNKAKQKGLLEKPDGNNCSVDKWVARTQEHIDYNDYVFKKRMKREKTPICDVKFSKEVLSDLWSNSDYSFKNYVGENVTEEKFLAVENELGYKLPNSYKELMKKQNGGLLKAKIFISDFKAGSILCEFCVDSIFGVDTQKQYSLCGNMGSKFWINEWGYPKIGIAIGGGISGGHEMFFLDYSDCGKDGEPCVVYIDQEDDYRINYLADNFQDFINGLVEYEE